MRRAYSEHLWVCRIRPTVRMRKQTSGNAGLLQTQVSLTSLLILSITPPLPWPSSAGGRSPSTPGPPQSHSRVAAFLGRGKGFARPVEGTVQKDEAGQARPGEHDDREGHTGIVDQLWKEEQTRGEAARLQGPLFQPEVEPGPPRPQRRSLLPHCLCSICR